ncbi:MAG TPA: hypothetical protein VM074_01340 [Solimonas sp.]|nr:hypothetical protein [Solimonas sp.]
MRPASVVAAGLLCFAGSAPAFELVTPDEYLADQVARPAGAETPAPAKPRTRSLKPLFPRVEVLAPDSVTEVKPPVRIELRFIGEPGTPVDPASFHVYYGFLGIDITERIRDAAQITPEGLVAEGAELPVGSHSLKLTLADAKGRGSSTVVKFKVVAP